MYINIKSFICLVLPLVCAIGLLRFNQENNPYKLWIPQVNKLKSSYTAKRVVCAYFDTELCPKNTDFRSAKLYVQQYWEVLNMICVKKSFFLLFSVFSPGFFSSVRSFDLFLPYAFLFLTNCRACFPFIGHMSTGSVEAGAAWNMGVFVPNQEYSHGFMWTLQYSNEGR